jgi:hypothetical protein
MVLLGCSLITGLITTIYIVQGLIEYRLKIESGRPFLTRIIYIVQNNL